MQISLQKLAPCTADILLDYLAPKARKSISTRVASATVVSGGATELSVCARVAAVSIEGNTFSDNFEGKTHLGVCSRKLSVCTKVAAESHAADPSPKVVSPRPSLHASSPQPRSSDHDSVSSDHDVCSSSNQGVRTSVACAPVVAEVAIPSGPLKMKRYSFKRSVPIENSHTGLEGTGCTEAPRTCPHGKLDSIKTWIDGTDGINIANAMRYLSQGLVLCEVISKERGFPSKYRDSLKWETFSTKMSELEGFDCKNPWQNHVALMQDLMEQVESMLNSCVELFEHHRYATGRMGRSEIAQFKRKGYVTPVIDIVRGIADVDISSVGSSVSLAVPWGIGEGSSVSLSVPSMPVESRSKESYGFA